MQWTRKRVNILATVSGAVVGAVLAGVLAPEQFRLPVVVLCAVIAGIVVGAQVRPTGAGRGEVRVARTTASRLEELQANALAEGWRGIARGPVTGLLDHTRAHYLAVSRTRVLRQGERRITVVRCIAMLHLGNGEMRCAEIDVDEQQFLGLDTIEELGEAAGIVKQFAAAPALNA